MFQLPTLSYAYDALEPHIDAATMEIHHSKHHAGYVKKLNAALEGHDDLAEKSVEDLLVNLDAMPQEIRIAVRNNGGGHANHSLFWQLMRPPSAADEEKEKAAKLQFEPVLIEHFGSVEQFQAKFEEAAAGRFGSGWAWLVAHGGELEIMSTPNQDSPLSEGKTPILGIDVWEHAYYLKYQNKRADYISAWWELVDPIKMLELYQAAR